MADVILKGIYTVQSKLADLPVKNGQLIFASDTNRICLDFKDKRVIYEQIVTLETDEERSSMLAPSDLFYFVKDTSILWRYTGGQWVQLTTNPAIHIQYGDSTSDFPVVGKEFVLYISNDNIYRWDDTSTSYKKMTISEDDLSLAITEVKSYVDEKISEKRYSANTSLEFPLTGDSNVLYVATQENKTYRWDEDQLKYYCIGSDYNEIEYIDATGK